MRMVLGLTEDGVDSALRFLILSACYQRMRCIEECGDSIPKMTGN